MLHAYLAMESQQRKEQHQDIDDNFSNKNKQEQQKVSINTSLQTLFLR
jgi:hypothetical protein